MRQILCFFIAKEIEKMKKETIKKVAGLSRSSIDFTSQKRGCVFQDKRRRSKERTILSEMRSYT